VVAPYKRSEGIVRSTLSLCRMLGTEKQMARVIAVDRARQETGLDLAQFLPVDNSVPESPVTLTELGKILEISGKAMNRELLDCGFQERGENGDWAPTDKGRPFCTVNPYKSPHSEHAGCRFLWYRQVLDELTKGEASA
jgi:hypothetical protein